MTYTTTRRGFLAGTIALGATAISSGALASVGRSTITAGTRVLDIDGRAATVLGLTNNNGSQGLVLEPGQLFQLDLVNDLSEETIIHWHGQLPPNRQDGVPGLPLPMLQPGEVRSFDFIPSSGTHWMHSHMPVQEMDLLAAPLIVRRKEEVAAGRQEVVLFLHDFSFHPAEEVLEQITSQPGHAMEAMDHSTMDMSVGMSMSGMAMDLNDFEFDAYLANDRTLSDPEVVQVETNGRVLLRVVNAASATTFFIDTGATVARLVAVDGHPIMPITGSRFGLAMAQRLDIELDLDGSGAFPILALREGARERTGLILATPGAAITKVDVRSQVAAPAFDLDLAQELLLSAMDPLPARGVDRAQTLMLEGSMAPYVWKIDGQTWGNHRPASATSGERVELTFHNMSMMGHPMHLHGHVFQVTRVNGVSINGAIRDTVYVPPMARITVALDAGEAARWMLHCHHIPHLATGMMTEFSVSI